MTYKSSIQIGAGHSLVCDLVIPNLLARALQLHARLGCSWMIYTMDFFDKGSVRIRSEHDSNKFYLMGLVFASIIF